LFVYVCMHVCVVLFVCGFVFVFVYACIFVCAFMFVVALVRYTICVCVCEYVRVCMRVCVMFTNTCAIAFVFVCSCVCRYCCVYDMFTALCYIHGELMRCVTRCVLYNWCYVLTDMCYAWHVTCCVLCSRMCMIGLCLYVCIHMRSYNLYMRVYCTVVHGVRCVLYVACRGVCVIGCCV